MLKHEIESDRAAAEANQGLRGAGVKTTPGRAVQSGSISLAGASVEDVATILGNVTDRNRRLKCPGPSRSNGPTRSEPC